MRFIAWLILFLTIFFNLWLNFPETQILADPNDNIFQYSLVYRTNWVWQNYGCPFSLSCLPNLLDHNVTAWAEGYPLPFYYSHIPQIATVASYNLFIKPISSLFALHFSLYSYYNWTKYLLYALFPIPIFLALRIIGFNPFLSALGAFFSSHLSTDGLYGIDQVSALWRGYGLTSQLYALFFLPLAIAFVYRALHNTIISNLKSQNSKPQLKCQNFIVNTLDLIMGDAMGARLPARAADRQSEGEHGMGEPSGRTHKLLSKYTILATIFLILTTAGHLGIGIIGLLSTLPFLFFDLNPRNIFLRIKKLLIIGLCLIVILSYWIIPLLLNNNYHIISFWDPLWKFDSYGWFEVVRQFFMGEIFDWQRSFPVITILIAVGFFTLITNSRLFPFSLLFAFWILMYFGRTTWGGIIDLIPGMKDFHQHRFIVGVHMAALFLIPAGIEYLFQLLKIFSKLFSYIFAFGDFRKLLLPSNKGEGNGVPLRRGPSRLSEVREVRKSPLAVFSFLPISLDKQRNREIIQNIIFYILILSFISILVYFTVQKTIQYAQLNNRWIGEANHAYRYDEKNFNDLVSYLNTLPPGRLYAGRPGNWGKAFRLGSTQFYMLMGVNGFDMSQFLPETWSPLSENEQNFDERVAEDYDLLNIRYIVSDANHDFTPKASLDKKFGPFELYQVPTTGWFDVVTSPMFVKTDKTNYINLVHFWHRSYPRRYKMHPLISVEKNPKIPSGMQKIIEMKDEVSYQEFKIQNPEFRKAGDAKEGSQTSASLALSPTKWSDFEDVSGKLSQQDPRNIFKDFPFVFPEATVSGKIKNEAINRQTYSATVEVPPNCKNCMVMFKMSYHPNWELKVDGQKAEKLAVFPFYLAAQVTPGIHTVEFTYQPNRLKTILIITEILLFLLYYSRKKIIIIHKKLF